MDFSSAFYVVLQVLVLLLALTVHESAHAWAADRLGDPTAKLLGRISLNPLVHIDLFGTVIFPAILWFTGNTLFGWAKPVPVNPMNLRNPRTDGAWISAAGPLSNMALALAAIISFRGLRLIEGSLGGLAGTDTMNVVFQFLALCAVINLILAAFNLIPIPPLDGGGILGGILPDGALPFLDSIRPYGFMILLVLLMSKIIGVYIGYVVRLTAILLGVQ